MKKVSVLILILLCVSLVFAAGARADQPGMVFLVNVATPGQVMIGQCDGSEIISAAPGEHPFCHSDNVAAFQIGSAPGLLASIDVTQEGNFSKTLSDGMVISGALETVHHLNPEIRSYYVYIWRIDGGAK